MKVLKSFSLRPGVYLLNREEDVALFHTLGHHFYMKSPLVDECFEKLCESLLSVMRLNDLSQNEVMSHFSFDCIQKRLSLLEYHHLLLKIDEDINEQQIYSYQNHFLSYFYDSPALVQSYLEKIKNLPIFFYDLLNDNNILFSKLESIGFQNFYQQDYLQLMSEDPLHDQFDPSFIIVVGSWQNSDQLKKMNKFFFKKKKSWLLILKDFFGGQIGPYFSGRESPCFECMLKRKESFLEGDSGYRMIRKVSFKKLPIDPTIPSLLMVNEFLFTCVATEVFKLVTDLSSTRVYEGSLSIDAINLKTKFNEIFPVAFCSVCGGFNENAIGPLISRSN